LNFKSLLILAGILLFGNSCITPLDEDVDEAVPLLVIEGFIDDDFGPHEIRVATLAKFASAGEGGGINRLDASVRVFDDLGNSFELTRETVILEQLLLSRSSTGGTGGDCANVLVDFVEGTSNYKTADDFRGVPGRSYGLEVVLKDGRVYRSDLQVLPESPPIDSVIVNFATEPAENDLIPKTGIDVFVQWQDDAGANDFYSWQIDGTYRIETPDKTLDRGIIENDQICCLYDPRRLPGSRLGEFCWVVERNLPGTPRAVNDRLINGTNASQFIGFIEDDGRRFSSPMVPENKQYHLEVHQYRMNEQAFNFYNNIDILAEIDGEIFDPPPIGARGNIVSVSDPNEVVAGFFGVFGKKSKGFFVERKVLPEIKEHSLCGDCRFFAKGQIETPEVYR